MLLIDTLPSTLLVRYLLMACRFCCIMNLSVLNPLETEVGHIWAVWLLKFWSKFLTLVRKTGTNPQDLSRGASIIIKQQIQFEISSLFLSFLYNSWKAAKRFHGHDSSNGDHFIIIRRRRRRMLLKNDWIIILLMMIINE